ncbi:MAG: phosphotransferase, partial [Streptosporangiaceae bacterium]|nr:phosphotransferase [Streptosporangiaceae bacterium]
MTQPTPRRWAKRYPNPASCRSAAAHHQWLAELGAPVPQLCAIGEQLLEFDHVTGRHAQPGNLLQIAELLGRLHRTAYTTELHHARLDRPHTTSTGLTIPDFLTPRRSAITTLLTSGTAPFTPFTADQAVRELEATAHHPACLYKDSNPRNILITTTAECILIDFDVLTLAPAGYDLAKLIVTLTMTHGPLLATQIRAALAAYNTALTDDCSGLEPVPWSELMTWANVH